MKTIYKYELETSDEQEIEMPLFSEIICLQLQNDKPYIWVKIDTEFTNHKFKFRTFGTGQPIEPEFNGTYIGTYQLLNGKLVFHVFKM